MSSAGSNRKCTKRPEMAIYRPGALRSHKSDAPFGSDRPKSPGQRNEPSSLQKLPSSDVISKASRCDGGSVNGPNLGGVKKPERTIYAPPKAHERARQDSAASSGSGAGPPGHSKSGPGRRYVPELPPRLQKQREKQQESHQQRQQESHQSERNRRPCPKGGFSDLHQGKEDGSQEPASIATNHRQHNSHLEHRGGFQKSRDKGLKDKSRRPIGDERGGSIEKLPKQEGSSAHLGGHKVAQGDNLQVVPSQQEEEIKIPSLLSFDFGDRSSQKVDFPTKDQKVNCKNQEQNPPQGQVGRRGQVVNRGGGPGGRNRGRGRVGGAGRTSHERPTWHGQGMIGDSSSQEDTESDNQADRVASEAEAVSLKKIETLVISSSSGQNEVPSGQEDWREGYTAYQLQRGVRPASLTPTTPAAKSASSAATPVTPVSPDSDIGVENVMEADWAKLVEKDAKRQQMQNKRATALTPIHNQHADGNTVGSQGSERPLSRREHHNRISDMVRKIATLDVSATTHLTAFMRSDQEHIEEMAWNTFQSISRELKDVCSDLILKDLCLANKNNVDGILWRNCYCGIEAMREKQPSTGQFRKTGAFLLQTITNHKRFYEELIEDICRRHRIDIEAFCAYPTLDLSEPRSRPPNFKGDKTDRYFGIMIIHKLELALGDLERYASQIGGGHDLKESRKHYLRATLLGPKAARPYNQLALLANTLRRRLDTVYYLMRAQAVPRPFPTANQSLVGILSETYQMVVQSESDFKSIVQRNHGNMNKADRKSRAPNLTREQELRTEIWIRPDGTYKKTRAHDLDEDDRSANESRLAAEYAIQGSAAGLHKRCLIYFLECVRILHLKIGMESFEFTCERSMSILRAVLNKSGFIFAPLELVQMVSIAIFVIWQREPKRSDGSGGAPPDKPSGTIDCAQLNRFQFLSCFASMLLDYLNGLLATIGAQSGPDDDHLAKMHVVLPALMIWSKWMIFTNFEYDGLPQLELCPKEEAKLPEKTLPDLWETLASVANKINEHYSDVINDAQMSDIEAKGDVIDDQFRAVNMPEEVMCYAFAQFSSKAPVYPIKKEATTQETKRFCDYVRLRSLVDLCDYLAEMNSQDLSQDESFEYYAVRRSDDDGGEEALNGHRSNSPPPILGRQRSNASESSTEEEHQSLNNSGYDLLGPDRAHLLRQHRVESRERERIMGTKEGLPLILEISPTYLILDTNTWIEHLSIIRSLYALNQYTILVTFTVIQELQGLSRGDNSSAFLVEQGREALVWLTSTFRKAVENAPTSRSGRSTQGTQKLRAIAESDPLNQLTDMDYSFNALTQPNREDQNDDRILNCCLAYCDRDDGHQRVEIRNVRDESLKLTRSTVLITDDKNLRLKAHAKNVPAISMKEFADWAGLAS